jgi:hypothetical protein
MVTALVPLWKCLVSERSATLFEMVAEHADRGPSRPWRRPPFPIGLLVLAFCCAVYWVIGPKSGSGFEELMSIYFLGAFILLWLFCLACLGLCFLGRMYRRRGRTHHGLAPLEAQNPAVAAVVVAGLLLPFNAFALRVWISWSNQRSLSRAKERAERLMAEIEDFHGRKGSYPNQLDVLPSGTELPSFSGRYVFDGGGPFALRLHEDLVDLSGGIREWTWETDTREWTAVEHRF